MPKFRKVPVVIDAIKWDGTEKGAEKVFAEFGKENFTLHTGPGSGKGLHVNTPEGPVKARPSDYIVRSAKGGLFPCPSNVFEETYEAVPTTFKERLAREQAKQTPAA